MCLLLFPELLNSCKVVFRILCVDLDPNLILSNNFRKVSMSINFCFIKT